ncbi:leucine-rich repeat protein [Flavobacterium sp.]|uniref:leucine-rich repeat domain-containing protein n=1 Tax=Flavobacterium sp. TaxID=239 RepID=UPI0026248F9F|nr:leucine-rich repeat protein [Flavobacterium sp.]
MKKKILILFILLNTSLVLSQNFNYNGINYTVTDAVNFYVKVGSNSSFSGVATIPETVSYNSQNYTVNEIDYGAFSFCSGITSVTIPSTVTTISSSAFRNSPNLTSVIIPNSVTLIGTSAFFGCTGLTSLTIPNSVTMIEEYAFTSCTSLTSLTIPSSVVVVGYLAFSSCTGLTSLTVGCSSIGNSSFYQCTGLTSITILSSVNIIGVNAFADCTSLNTVNCYITTPLLIDYNRFQNVNIANCTLNVPIGTEASYEAAAVWTDFNPINGNLLATDSFLKDNFSFYPNPTKNELFIDVKNLSNTKLEVLDLNGKTVFNQPLNSNNAIDTSNLKNGIYLFKVTSDMGSVITKVIKN